ncbi:Hypothetical protein CINCED_3A025453 [Cinara cedri]|uniref:Uncharacterized protein n=1 Tax=Cinara cedri TaxID=506608 RepID=A0A5E4NGL1_9HEMI|nr:Hypothetical protein CINCED_3A025453 [Cinara cedri]
MSEEECRLEKEKNKAYDEEYEKQKKLKEEWFRIITSSEAKKGNDIKKSTKKKIVKKEELPPVRNAGPKIEPRIDFRRYRPYEDGITSKFGGHIPGKKFSIGITAYESSKNVRTVLVGGDIPEFKI